jgi:hypothetical protein
MQKPHELYAEEYIDEKDRNFTESEIQLIYDVLRFAEKKDFQNTWQ